MTLRILAIFAFTALGAWVLWPNDDEPPGDAATHGASANEASDGVLDPTSSAHRELLASYGFAKASFIPEGWDPKEEAKEWRQRNQAPSSQAPISLPNGKRLGTGDFVIDAVEAKAAKDRPMNGPLGLKRK